MSDTKHVEGMFEFHEEETHTDMMVNKAYRQSIKSALLFTYHLAREQIYRSKETVELAQQRSCYKEFVEEERAKMREIASRARKDSTFDLRMGMILLDAIEHALSGESSEKETPATVAGV